MFCIVLKNILTLHDLPLSQLFVGAVANGRAKFEAQTNSKPSPEKPMRFFGSRSRTNSPMLPVKTPKVPTKSETKKDTPDDRGPLSAAQDSQSGLKGGVRSVTDKDGKLNGESRKNSSAMAAGKDMEKSTKINNKLLSKMKR